jgi:hypothetical protein
MMDAFKALLKQPYWVIALVLGAALVALPCIRFDAKGHWTTASPSTLWPALVGLVLLVVSSLSFALALLPQLRRDAGGGLDLTRVRETDGVLSTTVSDCELRVLNGRIEDYVREPGTAIVLPCNEYFDDRCVEDVASALGAYVNRVFEGQAEEFVSLIKEESRKKLGPGVERQKTETERAESFGAGRCLLLARPLGRPVPLALVSTTTQRAGEGLASRISYLFAGMRELVVCLADARLSKVAMPVLGAGHGRIAAPLAFVGLLLAIAEAAHYGQGGQRLKRVTIVVFKRDAGSAAEVDRVVARRALALIGS